MTKGGTMTGRGLSFLLLLTIAVVALSLGAIAADKFAYEVTSGAEFGTIDLNTGVFTQIGTNNPRLVALGSVRGQLFGGDYEPGWTGNTLYQIDVTNGNLIRIGSGSANYFNFGSTTSGLYIFGQDSNLYSIDPNTGASVLVGPTGVAVGSSAGGMSVW